jgi:glucoamylase
MYAPTSYEVAATVSSYNTLFCNEYKINNDDTAAGLPGVLYGRYGDDIYAGGNPWVLSTAALGQLFYVSCFAYQFLLFFIPPSESCDLHS